MELGLRELLFLVGVALIVGIIIDGLRRMRNNRNELFDLPSDYDDVSANTAGKMGQDSDLRADVIDLRTGQEKDESPASSNDAVQAKGTEPFGEELPNGGARKVDGSLESGSEPNIGDLTAIESGAGSSNNQTEREQSAPVAQGGHDGYSGRPVEQPYRSKAWRNEDVDVEDFRQRPRRYRYSEQPQAYYEDEPADNRYREERVSDWRQRQEADYYRSEGRYGRDVRADRYESEADYDHMDQGYDDGYESGDYDPRYEDRGYERAPEANKADERAETTTSLEDVLVINLVSPEEGPLFSGEALLKAAEMCELEFGDMDIFHRYERGTDPKVMFSMANLLEPGTFDPDAMETFETPGICLFLRLPGPKRALAALDCMIDVSRKVAVKLSAEMRDEKHNVMTPQIIESYRSRVMEFERRRRAQRYAAYSD